MMDTSNVIFSFGQKGVGDFTFQLTDHYVENPNDWGGVQVAYDSAAQQGTLTVTANRENSADIANWFNGQTNNIAIARTHDSSTRSPGKLNFGFTGTLSFSLNGKQIVLQQLEIGQGQYQGSNNEQYNWWLGCANATKSGSSLVFKATNGQVVTIATPTQAGPESNFLFNVQVG